MKFMAANKKVYVQKKMIQDQYDLEGTIRDSRGRWHQRTSTVYDQRRHLRLQQGPTNQWCLLLF